MDTPLEQDVEFWTIGFQGGYSRDLRPCIYVGFSAVHIKTFNKIPKEDLDCDPSRLALMARLCASIKHSTDLPGKRAEWADFVRRWVKWADAVGDVIAESSAVDALKRYCKESHAHRYEKSALLNVVARALELPRSVTDEVLGYFEKKESEISIWQLHLADTNRTLDFGRLIISNNADRPIAVWRKIMPEALADLEETDRVLLIRKIYQDFSAAYLSRLSRSKTLSSKFDALRNFVAWCDHNDHGQNLTETRLVLALKEYVEYLRGQIRCGRYIEQSAYTKFNNVVTILTEALDVSYEELTLEARMSLPSARYDPFCKDDSEALREYCGFLHALIEEITSVTILNPIKHALAITVSLKTIHIDAPSELFDLELVSLKIANRRFSNVRILCEMLRFIALTGAVLQMAEDITVGEWQNLRGGRISLFKNRANKLVELSIPKQYESCVNRHIEFLKAISPLQVVDDTPLFPKLAVNGTPLTVNAHAGSGRLKIQITKNSSNSICNINKIFREQGVECLTTRQLRKAKASWLLRRYDGDPIMVSRILGNSPKVSYKNYRGQGMFVVAESEWGRFWRVERKLSASLAPGTCSEPGEYVAIIDGMDSQKCNDAMTCLLCFKYCGEDSVDYIHQMLTLSEVVKARGISALSDKMILERIQGVVDSYCKLHPNVASEIAELKFSVELRKNWHERYASVLRILYAS
nr:hypothetical protein [uncultured Pseudomonas sp.]